MTSSLDSGSTQVQHNVEKEPQVRHRNDHTMGQELTDVQKYILCGVLAITLFIFALEQTIQTSSLPQITAALHSANGYTWIGTAYLLASASVLPVYGKLSDIYGRKPMLLIAILLFILGSVLAGAAVSMTMLIIARAIQGLGGGGIIGLVNIIIADLIPLHKRGMVMGVIGCVWLVSSAIGPLIGGALTQNGLWRWCFYINVPIAAVCLVVLFFVLKVHQPRISFYEGIKRIDFVGILLSISATCLLLLALDWGGVVYAWGSAIIISFFAVSVALVVAFVVYEAYVPPEPLIPLHLIWGRNNATNLIGSFMHATSFMGVNYFLPFVFQSAFGQTPIIASLYVVPMAAAMGITSALGGMIIQWTQRYVYMQRLGLAATCAFLGLLSTLQTDSSLAKRIIYPMLFGIPVGLNFQSFLIGQQTKVENKDLAVATSIQAFIRQIGLSLGIALGGVAFQNKIISLARTNGDPRLQPILSGNAPSSVNIVDTLPPDIRQVARNYYMDAFRVMFYVFVGFAGLGTVVACFVPQNSLRGRQENTQANEISDPQAEHV